MAYVNVGAYVDGIRPKTKKALREALKANPEAVRFDSTALMGPEAGSTLTAADSHRHTLQVCGPDPYTDRKWYASVKNGKIS